MNEQEIKAVDDHIEQHAKVTLKAVDFSNASNAQLINIAGLAATLCGYFNSAKPAIDFAVKYLLFWKPKWQTVIRNVEQSITDVCAALNPPTT
jgi:hypothetical protein